MRGGVLRRARRRPDAGFTLVEVMMAIVILGILSAAIVGIILQTQGSEATNRSRIAASNLAAREVDMVRDQFHRDTDQPTVIAKLGTVVNPNPLAGGTAGQPLVVDGTPFTVTRSVHWNVTGTGKSACDGGTLVIYPTLQVTVQVTWPRMGPVQPVVDTAQLAPDKGAGIPSTDSFIAVRAVDQDLNPMVGTPIAVTGGAAAVTQTTDGDGCAVLEVSPAVGTGTQYTAQATGTGLVDVGNNLNPSKSVGLLPQGQLATVKFTLAVGGSVAIRLTDAAGNPIPPAQANGAPVTLWAPDSAGNKTTPETIGANGLWTPPAGALFWPGRYGAFYGATPPDSGMPDPITLPSGGSITVNAVMQMATVSLTNLPPGTATVVAEKGAVATCDANAVSIPDPSNVTLVPGTWSFFATGSDGGRAFTCSPGPGSTQNTATPAVQLVGGDNGGIDWGWGATTLTFSGAGVPTGVPLYALDKATAGNLGTACPAPAKDASAYPLSPTAATPLPAGSYYVYARDTASTCKQPGSYLNTALYGQGNAVAWPVHTVSLTVQSIANVKKTSGTTYWWPAVYLSPVPVTDSTFKCTSAGVSVGGTVLSKVTYTAGSTSKSGSANSSSTVVKDGTWYVVANDEAGNTDWGTPTSCKTAGHFTVSSSTGSPMTFTYSLGSP